jgi:hypothetical protein
VCVIKSSSGYIVLTEIPLIANGATVYRIDGGVEIEMGCHIVSES